MPLSKISSAGFQDNVKFRNIIINGDMSIAQRGTSFAGANDDDYTLDRFRYDISGTDVYQFTISQDTDVPTGQGFAKSMKFDCTTADASLDADNFAMIHTRLEGQNLQYLKKGTSSAESTTLSFWVKSNKTGTYIAEFQDSDNNRVICKSYTISSSDTWEKKTITFVGDTTGAFDNDNAASLRVNFWLLAGTQFTSGTLNNDNGSSLQVNLFFTAGSNFTSGTLNTSWGSRVDANRAVGQVNALASANDYVQITGVQLEAGTTASDFEFLPHDVNKHRCLRYFQDLAPKKNDCRIAIGENVNTNRTDPVFQYVEKRANPSVTFSAANTFSLYHSNTSRDCTSLTADNFSEICGNLNANVSSGLTAGGANQFITNGTGSQLFVDAEL